MLFYFAFSHFHYWGKLSSGSMQIERNTLHGISAQLLSWPSSFPQARPMLCTRKFQAFNNNMMNQSPKLGNAFKITLQNVLIMGWRIGYYYRLSITGWTLAPMRPLMLLLEVHSCHLHFQLRPLLWRKWPPSKVEMKNEFRPTRGVEVCINSRR